MVRSREAVRGNILARCVLRRLAVARNCSDAFSDALSWQFSRFMHPRRGPGREKRPSLAIYRRHASKMSWLWQYSRAVYPKSPANRLSGMHSAHILPGRGPFRCTDPSNHARRANPAIPPAPPNSASAAASVSAPSARPIALKRGPEADVTRPHSSAPNRPSAVPRSHPLQLRLPWRSTFPTRGASLRLYFALSAAAVGI